MEPMLSKRVDSVPEEAGYVFEPKWDGFRTIVFRDGDELALQSRDLKPMQRYFPELIAPLKTALPDRAVVDGEIVLPTPDGLDFELLQQRIHPAASRVAMLAEKTPVRIVLWDLLALGEDDLRSMPFVERRARLLELLKDAKPPVHVTPATTDRAVAVDWFHRFEGAGFDGVMAKPEGGAYEPGKRSMLKIKHARTCDAVVAGFRWHKNGMPAPGQKEGTLVGSLLLGLYANDGEGGAPRLHHIGVTASFTEKKRRELVEFLAPYRVGALEGHPWKDWADWSDLGAEGTAAAGGARKPGAKSRWSRGKTLEWEPVRIELVCEVGYDHMQGARFRHTGQFVRWRTDKPPHACTFEQLEETPPAELSMLLR